MKEPDEELYGPDELPDGEYLTEEQFKKKIVSLTNKLAKLKYEDRPEIIMLLAYKEGDYRDVFSSAVATTLFIEGAIRSLQRSLPQEDTGDPLLAFLQGIAGAQNVKVIDIDLNKKEPPSGKTKIDPIPD